MHRPWTRLALAAAAAGADGLMIEVHDDPAQSKCDAAQAVTPAQFAVIADRAEAENETRLLSLKGKVQGWLVSDEINKAEINDKF